MKLEELSDFLERHNDEYLRFDRVQNKLSLRPDLHAFRLLDKLVPGTHDIVTAAQHDEFYLDTDPADLLAIATDEEILDLHRCGVMYSEEHDSLWMFA